MSQREKRVLKVRRVGLSRTFGRYRPVGVSREPVLFAQEAGFCGDEKALGLSPVGAGAEAIHRGGDQTADLELEKVQRPSRPQNYPGPPT